MLAVRSTSSSEVVCTPNILPCRIHHDGPTKVTKRYWAPAKDKDGAQTAYFRGRRLRGRAVKLPSHYRGMVLKTTEKTLPQPIPSKPVSRYDDEEDDDFDDEERQDLPEPIKILENIASFDELFVWGHDQIPTSEDPFVRNVEEWISFAEAIHGSGARSLDSSVNMHTTDVDRQKIPDKEVDG